MRSAGCTSSCVLCFVKTGWVMIGWKFRRVKGRWLCVNDLVDLWKLYNYG